MLSARWRSQPAMGEDATPIPALALTAEEWQVLVERRPNLLLCGSKSAVEATIIALGPHLRPNVYQWTPSRRLLLPADGQGTVILRDVHAMSDADQRTLQEYACQLAPRMPQIVSTSAVDLYARVEQRRFLAKLYYCLNTIYLNLGLR